MAINLLDYWKKVEEEVQVFKLPQKMIVLDGCAAHSLCFQHSYGGIGCDRYLSEQRTGFHEMLWL